MERETRDPKLLQNMFPMETYFELIKSNPEIADFIIDLILKRDIRSWLMSDIIEIYKNIENEPSTILKVKSLFRKKLFHRYMEIREYIIQKDTDDEIDTPFDIKYKQTITDENEQCNFIFTICMLDKIIDEYLERVQKINGPSLIFDAYNGGILYELSIRLKTHDRINKYSICSGSIFGRNYSIWWNNSTYSPSTDISCKKDIYKLLYSELIWRTDYGTSNITKITEVMLIKNTFTDDPCIHRGIPIIEYIIKY